MPKEFLTRKVLSKASTYVLSQIEAIGKPIVSDFDLARFIAEARSVTPKLKLNLRAGRTPKEDLKAIKDNLAACSKIALDPDYKQKSVHKVLTIPDMPAEDIVCLVDPLAYVSHLSAMQRWGLTDRVAKSLQISQPKATLANWQIREIVAASGVDLKNWPLSLPPVVHPFIVRKMTVHVCKSERLGQSRTSPGSFTRVASIGQTFADMVQEPELCGGMSHVLSVWDEHASVYLQLIIDGIDSFCSDLAKRRAGYILQERLNLAHPVVDQWKLKTGLSVGGKLDPSKEYSAETSKAWNLSLNV